MNEEKQISDAKRVLDAIVLIKNKENKNQNEDGIKEGVSLEKILDKLSSNRAKQKTKQ